MFLILLYEKFRFSCRLPIKNIYIYIYMKDDTFEHLFSSSTYMYKCFKDKRKGIN